MRGAAEAKKLERGAIRAMISSLLAAFFKTFFLSLYFIVSTIRTGNAVQHEVLRLYIITSSENDFATIFIFECCSCSVKKNRYNIAVQAIKNSKSIIQNWLNFVC